MARRFVNAVMEVRVPLDVDPDAPFETRRDAAQAAYGNPGDPLPPSAVSVIYPEIVEEDAGVYRVER
jgi:hypothetical protein